jgi:excisionase family DNA binding protein
MAKALAVQKPTIPVKEIDERKFISIVEAAELVSVSEGMIRRFLERKQIKRYKLNSRTLVSASEVLGLVREA